MTAHVLACERRRISGCHWFGGDKRQPEIRLRSQATHVPAEMFSDESVATQAYLSPCKLSFLVWLSV